MSDDLYATRLRWTGGRGIAKLRGHCVTLTEPPELGDMGKVDSIDYAPEVRVYMVMPRFSGWRDMTAAEIAQCDQLLRQLCGGES